MVKTITVGLKAQCKIYGEVTIYGFRYCTIDKNPPEYLIITDTGMPLWISETFLTLPNMTLSISTHKKEAVYKTAMELLTAQNQVTTLEIKTALRANSTYSHYYWDQNFVSLAMQELQKEGKFDFVDNGIYRIYSGKPSRKAKTTTTTTPAKVSLSTTPVKPIKVATTRISRKKALEFMQNNRGRFFTATFKKQDGTMRTINCMYLKDQTNSDLGYVKVKEAIKMKSGDPSKAVRQINLQTLAELKIAGQLYKIR